MLVVTSKNLLRTLLMSVTEFPEEALVHLDIPNGVPILLTPHTRELRMLGAGRQSRPWPSPKELVVPEEFTAVR